MDISVTDFRIKNIFELTQRTYKHSTQFFSKMIDKSQFIYPNLQPIVALECDSFNKLDSRSQKYAHYLSKASWYGGLIVLFQTSSESPLLFTLLSKLIRDSSLDELAYAANFSKDELQALYVYICGIFCNMGNYKSFGDTKFIPNLPKLKFEKLIQSCNAYKKDSTCMDWLWSLCKNKVYSLEKNELYLGLGNNGVTTYFSANCTLEDSEKVKLFLQHNNIEAYNTRVFKKENDVYEIRIASVVKKVNIPITYNNSIFIVTYGDYSPILSKVVHYLQEAKHWTENDVEKEMIQNYIESFNTGLLTFHKTGSIYWIKNKDPIVESYIGFIEVYRDPVKMRGEFEGFVAVVNKSTSIKYKKLVENANSLVTELPWGADYEKDAFLEPDFTCLDVLTFSGSSIPSGINIPNYDEIRQNEGFKNVTLGNVISNQLKRDKLPFLSAEDQVLINEYHIASFEINVGLHELLGHGSGKLFCFDNDKGFNFNKESVKHLLTKDTINTWYNPGETYNSRFTTLASTYEECRAECVALFMCDNLTVLGIFGKKDSEAQKIVNCLWTSMIWKGLCSLELFDPLSNKWLQAHCQARYVIFQVLLEAGGNFIKVDEISGKDENSDLLLFVDCDKIKSIGKPAIGSFLQKLQVFKSTGDIDNAKSLFDVYSRVNETVLGWRNIVMLRKLPRNLFVQSNTFIKDDKIEILNYSPDCKGLIQSWKERFPEEQELDEILTSLWKQDDKYFSSDK